MYLHQKFFENLIETKKWRHWTIEQECRTNLCHIMEQFFTIKHKIGSNFVPMYSYFMSKYYQINLWIDGKSFKMLKKTWVITKSWRSLAKIWRNQGKNSTRKCPSSSVKNPGTNFNLRLFDQNCTIWNYHFWSIKMKVEFLNRIWLDRLVKDLWKNGRNTPKN